MRRPAAIVLLVLGATLTAACGEPSMAGDDLVFLNTGRGVAVLATGAGETTFTSKNTGLPTPDWSSVIQAVPEGGLTHVTALSPSTGLNVWTQDAPGRVRAKVVSADGDLVALGPRREAYYAGGRPTTTLVIAGRGLPESRTIELPGNYEPEAFSLDGGSLFVLEYSPALKPTRYQVRELDLETTELSDVYTPDAELQGQMRGTARVQAMSADGARLYTLYTQRTDGVTTTFVHVLDLAHRWAHCIDLPAAFGRGRAPATSLALSPGGERLFVANKPAGLIADIDTEDLSVERTAEVPLARGWGQAVAGPDGIYVASMKTLTEIDTGSLQVKTTRRLPQRISGMQVSADGKRLFIGQIRSLLVLALPGMRDLDEMDPPDVGRIYNFGPAVRITSPVPETITCAC